MMICMLNNRLEELDKKVMKIYDFPYANQESHIKGSKHF